MPKDALEFPLAFPPAFVLLGVDFALTPDTGAGAAGVTAAAAAAAAAVASAVDATGVAVDLLVAVDVDMDVDVDVDVDVVGSFGSHRLLLQSCCPLRLLYHMNCRFV
jgi:hypothetical protein